MPVRDRGIILLDSKLLETFATWEALSKGFLTKFFLPSKTTKIKNDISTFTLREDKISYEAWERYKTIKTISTS